MAGSAETPTQGSEPNAAGQEEQTERKVEFLGAAPKEKQGPDVNDAVRQARERMKSGKRLTEGGDVRQSAEEEPPREPAGEEQEEAEGAEIGDGEHAQWRPGDPTGTYRDEKNRLRWAETADGHNRGDFASAKGDQAAPEEEEEGSEADAQRDRDEEEAQAAGEEEGEGQDGDEIVVALPGRAPEDPEIEFVVQDKESADALRRLKNGFMRGEEVNRQLEEVSRQRSDVQGDQEELESIMAEVAADPAGFVMKEVRNPEIAQTVVLSLLSNADDATFQGIMDEISEWERDPRARENAKLRTEYDRRQRADAAMRDVVRRRDARKNAVRIRESIESLMPDNMDSETRQRFLRYAGRDLRDHVNQHRIERLDPNQVPSLLEELGTLQVFGLKATPRVDRARKNGNTSSAARAASAAADDEAVERARGEGARVRRAVARRKDAASSAGPGAGAAATRTRPPKGAGLSEAFDHMRKSMGRR